jgi:hypothetical protein
MNRLNKVIIVVIIFSLNLYAGFDNEKAIELIRNSADEQLSYLFENYRMEIAAGKMGSYDSEYLIFLCFRDTKGDIVSMNGFKLKNNDGNWILSSKQNKVEDHELILYENPLVAIFAENLPVSKDKQENESSDITETWICDYKECRIENIDDELCLVITFGDGGSRYGSEQCGFYGFIDGDLNLLLHFVKSVYSYPDADSEDFSNLQMEGSFLIMKNSSSGRFSDIIVAYRCRNFNEREDKITYFENLCRFNEKQGKYEIIYEKEFSEQKK